MSNTDIRKIDKNMDFTTCSEDGCSWYSVDDKPFVLDGLYWRKPGGDFNRLPVGYSVSPGVDALSWHTAGAMLRFISDADEIRIAVKLHHNARMYHMAHVGSMGFDLYCGSGSAKQYVRSTKFDHTQDEYQIPVFELGAREHREREFTLHFPLYCGVKEFKIGLNNGATVKAPTPWPDSRPVVVYGTSIQQGGCASRPGMCHTNIMSRMLNRPFINLGFSGSGKGQPVAAELLASVENPAMFVLDYAANAKNDGLQATLSDFIDILRKKHPETPILMVSVTPLVDELEQCACTPYRMAQTQLFLNELQKRRENGDKNIHFLDGSGLDGADWTECTVDGVHATDLGFYMIAKHTAPVIAGILERV